MNETLSFDEARKLVLHCQRLPATKRVGSAVSATLSAIEHLGYIQIDTISVVQRAHHHTLWNRNSRYKPSHLDQLLCDKKVFEYWSHAAAYLPLCDYRFSLPRKHALACGELKHWYAPDRRLIQKVLRRIEAEGPLMSKDFVDRGKKIGAWKAKPTKKALEYLFMQGDLMVPGRVNFHKVYDLTERVVPSGTDTRRPSAEEYARYLIHRFLRANGLGQPAEIAYLLKGMKPLVSATMSEMVSSGELMQMKVGGDLYFALPDSLKWLSKPLSRNRLKILSPFDNLVIQRKRMQALFGFDYLIECYVPEPKRRHGYFCLPILWDGRLVARMDCRADRNGSTLHLVHVALEANVKKTDELLAALRKELSLFLKFNECTHLQLHRTTPVRVKSKLRGSIKDLLR